MRNFLTAKAEPSVQPTPFGECGPYTDVYVVMSMEPALHPQQISAGAPEVTFVDSSTSEAGTIVWQTFLRGASPIGHLLLFLHYRDSRRLICFGVKSESQQCTNCKVRRSIIFPSSWGFSSQWNKCMRKLKAVLPLHLKSLTDMLSISNGSMLLAFDTIADPSLKLSYSLV